MKKLVCLIAVLALCSPLAANEAKVGSSGAQFLKIGVGSRYQGMGEASVATATDIYAAYWNPAGLAEVDGWAVGFTTVNWLLDINLNYVAAARYFEDVGTFAASVSILSMGEQDVTTVLQPDGTGQKYSAASYAVGLSYARRLTDRFEFGGTVKYLGEEIGEVDARGVALDFGTLLYTGYHSMRIGMSISNMGPDMKFTGSSVKVSYVDPNANQDETTQVPVDAEMTTTPYSLPLTFRVGLAYDVDFGPKSIVTLSSEFKHPNDNDQRGSLGAEFAYDHRFFLRGGYKINYDEETFALGGGLSTSMGQDSRLFIDYSWQDFGRLEAAQRFSVGFTF